MSQADQSGDLSESSNIQQRISTKPYFSRNVILSDRRERSPPCLHLGRRHR
jgi:hypothetical protein